MTVTRLYSFSTEPARRRAGDENGVHRMLLLRRMLTNVGLRMLLVLVAVGSVIPVVTSGGSTAAAAAGGVPGRVSISPILSGGDIVTGVRGTTSGKVILTGSEVTGQGATTAAFLFRGRRIAAPWASRYRY